MVESLALRSAPIDFAFSVRSVAVQLPFMRDPSSKEDVKATDEQNHNLRAVRQSERFPDPEAIEGIWVRRKARRSNRPKSIRDHPYGHTRASSGTGITFC